MLNETPRRITYAQQKLITLINKRQLRQWCKDNGFTHTLVYKLAMGDTPVTYKTMSSMCHLIAPIDWLFFIDEKLPYPETKVPQWDYNKSSKFITENKYNYKVISEQFNVTLATANNMFITHRTRPSPNFIRTVALQGYTDPIEFFIESEYKEETKYIPYVGDIVSYKEYIYLIISIVEDEDSTYLYMCKILNDNDKKSKKNIPLKNNITTESLTKMYVNPLDITTLDYRSGIINFLESTTEEVINKVKSYIVKTIIK